MRNAMLYLSLLGTAIIAVLVLLPILGMVLLLAALAVAVVTGFFLAAPLLARLPWFRGRIFVQQGGGRRTIQFGRLQRGHVADAEARVLPDEDEPAPEDDPETDPDNK